MSKVRFLTNLLRAATILGKSSEEAQFPASDVQIDSKKYCWRTTSLGSPDYISFDLNGLDKPAGLGVLKFDIGKKEPVTGEILYGKESGARGRVVSVTKTKGDWEAGSAEGSVAEGGAKDG